MAYTGKPETATPDIETPRPAPSALAMPAAVHAAALPAETVNARQQLAERLRVRQDRVLEAAGDQHQRNRRPFRHALHVLTSVMSRDEHSCWSGNARIWSLLMRPTIALLALFIAGCGGPSRESSGVPTTPTVGTGPVK